MKKQNNKNNKEKKDKSIKNNLNIKNIKEFLKKHYVTFFKNSPFLLAFLITTLINTILLRLITIHKIYNPK